MNGCFWDCGAIAEAEKQPVAEGDACWLDKSNPDRPAKRGTSGEVKNRQILHAVVRERHTAGACQSVTHQALGLHGENVFDR